MKKEGLGLVVSLFSLISLVSAQETNYDAETERSYKKNRISGWRISKDDLEFMVDGVNFHSSNLRCFTYKEDNKEYRRLLKILKENGEWEDIR